MRLWFILFLRIACDVSYDRKTMMILVVATWKVSFTNQIRYGIQSKEI